MPAAAPCNGSHRQRNTHQNNTSEDSTAEQRREKQNKRGYLRTTYIYNGGRTNKNERRGRKGLEYVQVVLN